MGDVISGMHRLERVVLPLLQNHSSVAGLVKASGLLEVEVVRALQWLASKKLCTLSKQEVEIAELDFNGRIYSKKLLPEVRFLSAVKDGKSSLGQLKKSSALADEEVGISIGLLKKDGLISVTKGRELEFEITEAGMEKLVKGFPEQLLLQALDTPRGLSELSREEKAALLRLNGRKEIVKVSRRKVVTASLTAQGKEIAKSPALRERVVDRLAPEMLKDGSWVKANFRVYDVNAAVPKVFFGKKQPYRRFLDDVRARFVALGFNEMTGPLVESEFWNMDALFMPQFHSARDIHDVYYVKEPKYAADLPKNLVGKVKEAHENGIAGSRGWRYEFDEKKTSRLILRSQTTACSARKLASRDLKIPGKYFAVGRCFRYDVIDAKHLADFNQVEGIVVEQGLNLSHLIGLLKLFAKEFCGTEEARVVPSYFPFTEPSAALYAKHPHLGWIELGGAGIFRPEMVKPLVGKHLPVLAWGIGIDRLAMFRLGLNDIRELFSHDLEYLRKARVV